MDTRTRLRATVSTLLIVGIMSYVIGVHTTSVRVRKLLAAVPEGQCATDRNPTAQAALGDLSAIGPRAVPVMIRQLSTADSLDGLYYGFVRIGPSSAPALLDYLRRTHKSRLIATAALANMAPLEPEHLEALYELARQGDSLTRSRCLVAAAKINPELTAERFEHMLEDDLHSSTSARLHATDTLNAIGPVNNRIARLIEDAGLFHENDVSYPRESNQP